MKRNPRSMRQSTVGLLTGPLLASLLAIMAAIFLPLAAAGQATTAGLRGTVTDDSGPVAGASVMAVGTDNGFSFSATSGADGGFNLPGLPPGEYQIIVKAGELPELMKTVQVQLGQQASVEFRLSAGSMLVENVTVVGDSTLLLVDTRSSEIATNISTTQIENLPQGERNFLNFANLAPGVSVTNNENDTQKFRSGGADSRQVNVFVDGLSYKNDVLQGGAFMQDSSRGNPFPQNAVAEFQVLTQNYKAEYEKAAAAVISAVTKSGGNDWNGEVLWQFQDKGMTEQDRLSKEQGAEKPDYKRDQYAASIGGPIVADKLNFFAAFERNEQDRFQLVSRGSGYGRAPANVKSLLDTYEVGNVGAPFESNLFFGKLSWQPSAGDLIDLSFNVRDEEEVRGFGGQRVFQGAESMQIDTGALVLKYSPVISSTLYNEAALTYQSMQWAPTGIDTSTPHLNYTELLDIGGKDANQDFQQDRIGIRDDLSIFFEARGSHSAKVGITVTRADYDVRKETFFNPLFEFRSAENWQFPFQARYGFGDPGIEFSNTQVGLYLQDDWQVTDNLVLNLGLRWDYESNMINNDFETPPELVAALNNAQRTYANPVGGQTTWRLRDVLDLSRYTTDGSDRDPYYGMIQPRIGFTWDVASDGKTVVYGGWGRYYDRVQLNDIFDEEYRQRWKIYSFCFSQTGAPAANCSVPALAWRPEYLSQRGLDNLIASGQAPGPEVFLVDNETKPPRSDQATVGIRQQAGSFLLGLAYSNVRVKNGLSWFFGDLPPGTAFADRFGNGITVPGYARIFVSDNSREGWYDALFLTVDKPYTADSKWGFNLAYTYAESDATGASDTSEGVRFSAFDYINAAAFDRHPSDFDERHRIVASGIVGLPGNFRLSSILTLGSGTPFTVFDASQGFDRFQVRFGEGRAKERDFLGWKNWVYRSFDMRLDWEVPVGGTRIGLIGEVFNAFNWINEGCGFEGFVPPQPEVNQNFGKGFCQFNTRRFQVGARVAF
jgi:hypothetical protein